MLVIPSNHKGFRENLDSFISSLLSDSRSRLSKDPLFKTAVQKVRLLNLDALYRIIAPLYSPIGPAAKQQIEIFRSIFLMCHFRITSFSVWHDMLIADPLLAGLCGFFDSVPSVGSFYHFMDRLYALEKTSHIQPADHNHTPRTKPKKGQKWENHPQGRVGALIDEFTKNGYQPKDCVILSILLTLGVKPSIQKGLIDIENLTVSGDGTAIHVPADSRGHSIQDDPGHRTYSDPDANIGWDSDINSYFFGYHGYFLCSHDSEHQIDLPLYFELNKASVHDALSGVTAITGLRTMMPDLHIRYVCLDSAHDNEATYQYIESFGAIPCIDPNIRSKRRKADQKEHMDNEGNMVCLAGIPMHNEGWDKTNKHLRFRCPCMVKKTGVKECPLGERCSKRPKGRIVNYRPDSTRNKYIAIRHTDKWKEVYKNRTSCERTNNRILNDYRLHQTKARGRVRTMFHLLMGFLNIHADAWIKAEKIRSI